MLGNLIDMCQYLLHLFLTYLNSRGNLWPFQYGILHFQKPVGILVLDNVGIVGIKLDMIKDFLADMRDNEGP